LYSSSLNVAKTFKSFTSISTAFALSCLSIYFYNLICNAKPHMNQKIESIKTYKYRERERERERERLKYLSRASRYFCFLISKKIFMEYRLSSTLVNPERYLSTSSHSPAKACSSKYFMLKKNPDSCSSLCPQSDTVFRTQKHAQKREIATIITKKNLTCALSP
jgi:hypothetical protein